MAKRKYEIVEVEWVDSMGFDGWQPEDTILDSVTKANGMTQYTCGYLLKRNREYVVIIGSHGDTDASHNVNSALQIPRRAVRKLSILRQKGK